jgi:hypothetical protein
VLSKFGLTIVIVVALMLLTVAATADTLLSRDNQVSGDGFSLQGVRSPFSLFDPARFQMDHSYSLTFFSSGGNGDMIAMYLNRMQYDLGDNLRLSVQLGWLHQPQAALGISEQTLSNQIYPAVRVDWQPFENVFIRVNYERVAPHYYYGGPNQRRSAWGGYDGPIRGRYWSPAPYGYDIYGWDRNQSGQQDAESEGR